MQDKQIIKRIIYDLLNTSIIRPTYQFKFDSLYQQRLLTVFKISG